MPSIGTLDKGILGPVGLTQGHARRQELLQIPDRFLTKIIFVAILLLSGYCTERSFWHVLFSAFTAEINSGAGWPVASEVL